MTLRKTTTAGLLIVACLTARGVQAQSLPGVATPIVTGGPIVGHELTLVWGAVPGADEYTVRIEGSAGEPVDMRVTPGEASCASGGVCTVMVSAGQMPAGRGQWAVQAGQAGALGEWSRWQAFTLAPTAEHAAGLSETPSNTSVGQAALPANTGFGNSALGQNTLNRNVGGNYNTASGHNALTYNSWGSWNTATGTGALQNNTSGGLNVAVGGQSLSSNTTGSWNTALGTNTLVANLASYNTGVGGQALYSNVQGTSNTAMGMNALFSNVSGNYNVATGYNALTANSSGIWNTAMGTGALQSLTSGNLNVAVGGQALSAVSAGSYNTAVGTNALLNNTGGWNTAVGNSALSANTTGAFNTGLGLDALRDSQSSNFNTAVGYSALLTTTGGSNTAVGYYAGGQSTLGTKNIFLGYTAGYNVTGGSDNIHIASLGAPGDSGVIRIGYFNTSMTQTYIDAIHGQTSSSGVAVFVNSAGRLGTISSSARFKDDIAPLGDVSARVQALRPVRFLYKPGVDDGSQLTQYGLIAEEVAAVIPDLVVRDEHGNPETVRYHFLPPLLLAEVQRLERERQTQATALAGQATELATQATALAAQARQIAELRALIDTLPVSRR